MNSLTIFAYQSNGIRFETRKERVWVNLTDMAKATNKLVADWSRLKSTNEFLEELESIMGIPIMISNVGGQPETTGTWAIEEVAIDFAAWCNTRFRIWVAQQIKSLINQQTVSNTAQLPGDVRVVNFVGVLKDLGCDITNPRFNQELQDFALDVAIGYNRQKQLASAIEIAPQETWLGVAERAEQLGYAITLVTKHRSQLGKYVKASGLMFKEEKRLCNGTQRDIKLYHLTEELDIAIKEFMDAKVLAS